MYDSKPGKTNLWLEIRMSGYIWGGWAGLLLGGHIRGFHVTGDILFPG